MNEINEYINKLRETYKGYQKICEWESKSAVSYEEWLERRSALKDINHQDLVEAIEDLYYQFGNSSVSKDK